MGKSIREYMQDIKKIYKEKSEVVEQKYNELKEIKAESMRVLTSRDYTAEGRQKRINELDAKKSALQRDLDALRSDANNEAMSIRNEVERAFYGYYNASPDDVDLKLTELIRSGVLTESELIHYGERANTTMRRLIGKELDRRGDHLNGSRFMISSGNPHLKAIDQLMEVGDYSVGGARLGGLESVHNIRERFDSVVDSIIAGTQNVSVGLDADGKRVYSENV